MRAISHQNLTSILINVLVIATRILRDIHVNGSTTNTLKANIAANEASARIGRAVRLATLLLRRIQIHGLLPFTLSRASPAAATQPATPRTQPRLHTGNADAAFIRRPIPIIVAAITRELHLAAQAMGVPLPEPLQVLCLQAAIATAAFDTPEPSNPSTGPASSDPAPTYPYPDTAVWNLSPSTTAPTETLEL